MLRKADGSELRKLATTLATSNVMDKNGKMVDTALGTALSPTGCRENRRRRRGRYVSPTCRQHDSRRVAKRFAPFARVQRLLAIPNARVRGTRFSVSRCIQITHCCPRSRRRTGYSLQQVYARTSRFFSLFFFLSVRLSFSTRVGVPILRRVYVIFSDHLYFKSIYLYI